MNGENGFLFIGCASALLPICVFFLEWQKQSIRIMSSLKWLGNISLESYLTNTTLPSYVFMISVFATGGMLSYGNYLAYLVVIVVGLVWAWLVHVLCNAIINAKRK